MQRRRPILKPTRRSFMSGVAGVGGLAAGLSFLPRGAMSAEEKKLSFYNWDTYIGETTLDDFNEATGIEAKMDLYADNDELFAKLKEGNPGYDVIVPTNDMVERMLAAEMLVPINHSKIPNMSNLEPAFQDANFDPGRKHTVPYMWGTIGVGYRKDEVEGVPASWKWLYESDEYSGSIALLGDGGTVIGVTESSISVIRSTRTVPARNEGGRRTAHQGQEGTRQGLRRRQRTGLAGLR